MPLPWVRLDTSMPDNPKILALADLGDKGLAAAFVWACSLAYSGKHGLDGFIPKAALSRINGKPAHARSLVDVGLWKDEGTGWSINGWEEYQESTVDTQARSRKAQLAALARWHPKGRTETDR